MDVFVVIKEGVYRHEIVGVFSNKNEAIKIANEKFSESDKYHDFQVREFTIDTIIVITRNGVKTGEFGDGLFIHSAMVEGTMEKPNADITN